MLSLVFAGVTWIRSHAGFKETFEFSVIIIPTPRIDCAPLSEFSKCFHRVKWIIPFLWCNFLVLSFLQDVICKNQLYVLQFNDQCVFLLKSICVLNEQPAACCIWNAVTVLFKMNNFVNFWNTIWPAYSLANKKTENICRPGAYWGRGTKLRTHFMHNFQ